MAVAGALTVPSLIRQLPSSAGGYRLCCASCYCSTSNSAGLSSSFRRKASRRIGTLKTSRELSAALKRGVSVRASQEASTSTLLVQEVDFIWKGQGSEVLLTGEFVNWETKLALEKRSDGVFSLKQKLALGRYSYKFIVDGEWKHSPDCPTVPDGTGGLNNEVVVTVDQTSKQATKDSLAAPNTQLPRTTNNLKTTELAKESDSLEKPVATPKSVNENDIVEKPEATLKPVNENDSVEKPVATIKPAKESDSGDKPTATANLAKETNSGEKPVAAAKSAKKSDSPEKPVGTVEPAKEIDRDEKPDATANLAKETGNAEKPVAAPKLASKSDSPEKPVGTTEPAKEIDRVEKPDATEATANLAKETGNAEKPVAAAKLAKKSDSPEKPVGTTEPAKEIDRAEKPDATEATANLAKETGNAEKQVGAAKPAKKRDSPEKAVDTMETAKESESVKLPEATANVAKETDNAKEAVAAAKPAKTSDSPEKSAATTKPPKKTGTPVAGGEVKQAPKAAPKATPKKKAVSKSLEATMLEDVIPLLTSTLGKEAGLTDLDISFEENQLKTSFAKGDIPYCFWAFFPDGTIEGSRGSALTSHGSPPSTIEPFLIDEKKISPELIVFWIKKRLFVQQLLSVN